MVRARCPNCGLLVEHYTDEHKCPSCKVETVEEERRGVSESPYPEMLPDAGVDYNPTNAGTGALWLNADDERATTVVNGSHRHWSALCDWLREQAALGRGHVKLTVEIQFADGVPQTGEIIEYRPRCKFTAWKGG